MCKFLFKNRASSILSLLLIFVCLFSVCQMPAFSQAPANKANKAQKTDPEARRKAGELLKKALLLVKKGEIYKAELVFQQAVSVDPTWDKPYHQQGLFYGSIKNYPNAAIAWEKAIKINPNFDKYRLYVAKAYSDALDWEHAESAWNYIAELDPSSNEARYQLAYIAFKKGEIEKADKLVAEAFEFEPGNDRLNILQAQIEIRNKRYKAARDRLKAVVENLPSNSPYMEEVIASLEEAEAGVRKQTIVESILISIPIVIVIAGFVVWRITRKVAFKSAPSELDATTEDAICRYVLTHVANITSLPRGLCWTVTLDGRHLELQVSELISEQSSLARSPIDIKAMNAWLEGHGRAPFLYKLESKEQNFIAAFPELPEALEEIEINIGVPIVWKNQLLGLALLGRSRSTAKIDLRKRFDESSERILTISEQGAVALDRLRHKNLKVLDSKTGLWNRDYFEKKLVDIFRGCQTANIPLAVFMMRMDQYARLLEEKDEYYCLDILADLSRAIQGALGTIENVTLCHLDNGVFSLIAPGRNAEEAQHISVQLKNSIDQARLFDRDIRPTGCVAYGVFPDDADDPKMLRAVVGRAFRDITYLDGNRIARAEKVIVDAVSEAVQEKEVVVSRRAGVREAAEAKANAQAPQNSPLLSEGLGIAASAAGASLEPERLPGTKNKDLGTIPSPFAEKPLDLGPKVVETDYKIEPVLDEYGVDEDTQFCSQETFEDVVNYEVSLAGESGESCAIVYLRLDNLKDLRAKGKDVYMQLRRDLAALVCAFLRDDIDVPGLIGEDDFAVFLIGTDLTAATSLADRISLTARNLDAAGCFIQLAIGVAMRAGEGMDGQALIQKASSLAHGDGIHVEEEAK